MFKNKIIESSGRFSKYFAVEPNSNLTGVIFTDRYPFQSSWNLEVINISCDNTTFHTLLTQTEICCIIFILCKWYYCRYYTNKSRCRVPISVHTTPDTGSTWIYIKNFSFCGYFIIVKFFNLFKIFVATFLSIKF